MGSLIIDYSFKAKTINKDWIWRDVKADFSPTRAFNAKGNGTYDSYYSNFSQGNRDLDSSKDLAAVQNAINNIFLFRPGERIILPEFGNNLYKFLYEPINDLTSRRIGTEIVAMIERWEPRVTVDQVVVTPYPDDNAYGIELDYTIPSLTDQVLNFKYALMQRR